MEWIFNGIGTELLSFLGGILFGVCGNEIYRNRQTQKAGKKSVQIQSNDKIEGNISADQISGDKNAPRGDYIYGNKIINNTSDECDISNYSHYSIAQIEDVIKKGNDATRRKWCMEIILNQGQECLIVQCIEKMNNDNEKYKLLEELSKRHFEDSKYFRLVADSLSNNISIKKAIELYISIDKLEYIESAFGMLDNNKCIYDSLIAIYNYNGSVFKKLYDNGNCFGNESYKNKMKNFLEEQHKSVQKSW